ncbi:MAG: MFS transporter [Microthrixaceae bacterium]|nr:MFS transporter [Microthrixaceae bacterium]MCB1012177.1 MFS transporter [Microthrixaceae bacterium]MCO5321799.1 MFS transporter [Microthrixaceae bacterium]
MGRPLLIEIDGEELSRRLEPRDDALVLERTDLDEPGERRFGCVQGPFTIYERVARWQDAGPDRYRYEQYVRFRPAIPVFGPMFFGLMRRTLRDGLPDGRSPIWALPDRLSAQQSTVVAVMCLFHVIGGMLYAFLTNVLTFAAADLGNGSAGEQSVVLAVARVGAVLTIATMAFADRVGRRRATIWAASAAVVLTVASAAAPNLAVLAVLQTLSRNLAIAAMLAADTLSIEEIPPGSRAAAQGLGALSYGLGAGAVVVALPLADLGENGWRLVFLVALLGVPAIFVAARHLPESRRFIERDRFAPSARKVSPGRFVYLAILLVLLNFFVAPSSQLQNDYLRTDRGFAGGRISLFILVTALPGLFGILIGGRLADRRSRRLALIPGLISIAVFGAGFFVVGGAPMWLIATLGAGLGTLAVPALGVLAPEMFPTARRGTARGGLSAIATAGSAAGLLAAGVLVDNLGYGTAFVWLAIAPLTAAVMAFWAPETSGVELEALNETSHPGDGLRPGPDPANRGARPVPPGHNPSGRGDLGGSPT